tara:strand:+ start:110 stop:934 length:825 start_codon:yes stop_codon:yes gene_type:complete
MSGGFFQDHFFDISGKQMIRCRLVCVKTIMELQKSHIRSASGPMALAFIYDAASCRAFAHGRRPKDSLTADEATGHYETKLNLIKDTVILEDQPLHLLPHDQLMELISRHRDQAAFKVLFRHFAPRVKSFLLGFGVTNSKAEELTQVVMVTLWRKAVQFDPQKAKLSTWIFRIARNKFIDDHRKHKYPLVPLEDHLKDMVAPEKTDQALGEKQEGQRIKTALQKLTSDQRKVIELSFFEELSHSKIAATLSLPLGTVKSRMRTAFGLLRKELRE